MTWAIGQLRNAFELQGVHVSIVEHVSPEPSDGPTVFMAGRDGGIAHRWLATAGVPAPAVPESFAIVPRAGAPDEGVLLSGHDERGSVYALLELTDRVEHAEEPLQALPREPIVERPANDVRSVTRLFCSEVQDKPWFYDGSFWDRYLSMLVRQRFNRFSLSLGLGYNYHRGITDAYFYFAYPFLLSVPGYDVRVPQITDDERARNLEALRSIAERAHARGLDFQLGLWTHAFEWIDSPDAQHTIEGLAAERHAGYCRDAVELLLEQCPAIDGLTFRIHGESGVPEGSWDFWRTVFDGVVGSRRKVGIDLHAKGLDDRMLRQALDTGLPVTVSPKFWAEHMGLGYHQAAIRESERQVREDPSHLSDWQRYMAVSEGSRPFTRYGYADFLREDRDYAVVFRLWAGTQRLLLWGDPATASAYGRSAHLAGAQGLEWCEPLTFKGREGSGVAGSRTGYADRSLIPQDDWEKFAYTYRLFGRLTYDPDAASESWRRGIPKHLGDEALDAEAGLAAASRILPLVTTAHHPSASNNYFWPEIYTDMPIVWTDEGTRPHPYLDTPEPRRFGSVGPLDPEVFSSVADFIRETLAGRPSGRISPLEVAARLERLSAEAAKGNATIDAVAAGAEPDVRRWIIDVAILASLGEFFAGKLRAAVWYELHASTGDPEAIHLAVDAYGGARHAWFEAVSAAGVYVDDLTFGPQQRLRGHWADRLDALDEDLRDMAERAASARSDTGDGLQIRRLLEAASGPRTDVEVAHDPPETFRPGTSIELSMRLRGLRASHVELRYRVMNQALPVTAQRMQRLGDGFAASIPMEVADGTFPLAYAFVVHDDAEHAWRYPGIGDELATQPYFVIRRAPE